MRKLLNAIDSIKHMKKRKKLNVDGKYEVAEHCNYREMVMKRA